MLWPSMTDYVDAVQHPHLCFSVPELRNASVEKDRFGLPKPITGGFACVYQAKTGSQKYAVRCFLHYFPDQEARYAIISKHLRHANIAATVDFDFISRGILIKGKWYPVLKMGWIDGVPLNLYIKDNLQNPNKLVALAEKFATLMIELHRNGIAHGDLQHGNILIVNDELRLIDYDGMFVPGLEGFPSHECGQRNYQHPARNELYFGPYLDHFSGLVIYLSLVALSQAPDLWQRTGAGEEGLLLRNEDFKSCDSSMAVLEISRVNDQLVFGLVSKLVELAGYPDISKLPSLQDILAEMPKPGPIRARPEPAIPRAILSDLEQDSGASWIWDHIKVPVREFKPALILERLSAMAWLLCEGLNLYAWTTGLITRPIFFLQAAVLVLSLFLIYNHRFRSLPAYSEKLRIRSGLKNVQTGVDNLKKTLGSIQAESGQFSKAEQRGIDGLIKDRDDTIQKYRLQILTIDKEFWTKSKSYDSQRKNIRDLETKEAEEALAEARRTALDALLWRNPIFNATIAGVGTELKQRLSAEGIRTAADILSVRITKMGWGKYMHDVAVINVRARGSVQVQGIGPKKIQSIWKWRQGLELKYKKQLPQTLPEVEKNRIAQKYKSALDSLDRQESEARRVALNRKADMQDTIKVVQERSDTQIHALQREYLARQQELERKYLNFQKAFLEKKTELGRIQKEMESFESVTFSNFLRQIFFIRKNAQAS
jgi:serine/threonine protein kinase